MAEADAFVGIDVFGASAPGGTCNSAEWNDSGAKKMLSFFKGIGADSLDIFIYLHISSIVVMKASEKTYNYN